MEPIAGDQDNIRPALSWCQTRQHTVALGLRLALAMFWIWEAHGQLGEGRRWLNALLAQGLHGARAR